MYGSFEFAWLICFEGVRVRRKIQAIAVVWGICTAIFTGPVSSQDTMAGFGIPQIVRLDPKGILPNAIRIKPGSTVIWLNSTRVFVAVVFSEGEAISVASQSPTRFFLAPDGTFTSNVFPPGAVASLAFVTPGIYRYFVSGVKGDFLRGEGIFGSIVVR